MKNITILLIASATLLGSCRKIIDVELDEADKRTSIDARVEKGTNSVTAKLTKSGNFFGENSNPAITDATVVFNDGSSDIPLINMGGGNYELVGYTASDNQNYSMKVTQGGVTYNATSLMPKLVEIDTVTATFQPQSIFNDEGYLINIKYQDPGSVSNYYRLELDIAGERYGTVNDLILLDDGLTNGNSIDFPLFGADVAQLGDTVVMYLISLDKQTYDYFLAVNNILSGNAATPANPKSNFDNNALGNFSAFAIDTMTIVVQ